LHGSTNTRWELEPTLTAVWLDPPSS
jgi:hypothetical protein